MKKDATINEVKDRIKKVKQDIKSLNKQHNIANKEWCKLVDYDTKPGVITEACGKKFNFKGFSFVNIKDNCPITDKEHNQLYLNKYMDFYFIEDRISMLLKEIEINEARLERLNDIIKLTK